MRLRPIPGVRLHQHFAIRQSPPRQRNEDHADKDPVACSGPVPPCMRSKGGHQRYGRGHDIGQTRREGKITDSFHIRIF